MKVRDLNEVIEKMNKTYTIINKFQCCGKTMLVIMMKNKSVCVMPEWEFNWIIETERRFKQRRNRQKKIA